MVLNSSAMFVNVFTGIGMKLDTYLKPFLQEISGDVGRLEAAAGSDFKAALLAKLQVP